MRRLSSLILGVALVLPTALPASAGPEDPWTFGGGGWGHGIGLSQFGAKGMAEDGRSVTNILQHYYTGSSLAILPDGHWTNGAEGLWIGLTANDTSVAIEAVGGNVEACQPASNCSLTLKPGEKWVFEYNPADPDTCRFRLPNVVNQPYGPCDAKVTQNQGTDIRLKVDGREHAHGTLRMTPLSSGFHTVLMISLERYLYGLAEMPSSWHPEALKAQAIVGRSYAVATAIARGGSDGSQKWSACGCHLRSTPADQAYAGWDKEAPANGGASWVAAVNATPGRILTHPSSGKPFKIIETYYSSSNGGASENNEDVWGGTPRPWLRSVDDPWSRDPSVNPLATWTVKITNANLAKALGWDKVYDAVIIDPPPGVKVRFNGKHAGQLVEKVVGGWDLRSILISSGFGYHAPGSPSSSTVRVSPYIASVVDPPAPFADVEGNVFEDAIEWLYEQEITLGCNPPSNTRYCPTGQVTRGEMGIFISRAMKLPIPKGDYFTDDNGTFWEGGANRMFESKITVGCGPSRYCGQQRLPREQMAVFLVRALNLPPSPVDYFTDDENSAYEDHINRIAHAKITVGCDPPTNKKFCPKDTVTRGQMAAFFKRAWGP